MTQKQLVNFFEKRPAINKSAFANETGISRQYLNMLLKGDRPVTSEVSVKLEQMMKKYGYEI